jgi:hypothetical protein
MEVNVSTRDVTRDEGFPMVMVRAFKEEPVRLRAVGLGDETVEVAGEDRSASIFFPLACVYRFDERLFQQLHSAYIAHDNPRLKQLWAKAERFEPAEILA